MSSRIARPPLTPARWRKQAKTYLNALGVQFADTAASLPKSRVAGKPLYFTVETKATEVGRVLKVKTFTYAGDYFGGNKA